MECVKKEGVGIFNFLHARGMDLFWNDSLQSHTYLSIMNFMMGNFHCFANTFFFFENNKAETF